MRGDPIPPEVEAARDRRLQRLHEHKRLHCDMFEDVYFVECWDCCAKVESFNGLEDAVAGWNARAIDRDELLKVADECDRAAVDGVTDWAERIRKAVG